MTAKPNMAALEQVSIQEDIEGLVRFIRRVMGCLDVFSSTRYDE